MYLFLDVNNLPKGKNLTIEFILKFINHKDPNEMVQKGKNLAFCYQLLIMGFIEFKTTFPIKGGQGWGDRRAIKSNRITEEAGFLKADTLHLEASMSIKKVFWTLSNP